MEMTINNQARTALLATLDGVTDEAFNQKPAPEAWSLKQIFEHLYLMESAVAKMVETEMTSGREQEVKKRRIEATVDRSIKVSAPEFVLPTDTVATIDEIKEKLMTSHEALHTVANQFTEAELAKKATKHPAFGDLGLDQWIPFVGYHEMRHHEQVNEVKAALNP